jgi:GGDEF domain-containing protein
LPCGERTIVGRWADDQFFLVILNDCSGDSLRAVGNRTNRMLASDGMEWRGAKRSVSVSIGHAVARAGDTGESMLERARHNMQAASIHKIRNAKISNSKISYSKISNSKISNSKISNPTTSVTKSAKGTASGR